MSIQFFAMPVSRGVAIGRAVLVASSRVDVAHYFIAREHVDVEVVVRFVQDEHIRFVQENQHQLKSTPLPA